MSDEEFSEEYFRHLLSSLTLNSRALISELTNLAENNVEYAQQIVKMTEDRILKILPKYKLYAFYLMDSIIKNIGSPYNLMFSANLYKNFTETYMVIDDTPTRQNLINLFKTWLSGKTVAGSDLFPKEMLQKVEKFIIQATSINTGDQQDGARSTREAILRESNYLLQYIIALDEEFESAATLKEGSQFYEFRLTRNMMILEINSISEAAMLDCKGDFEMKKASLVEGLEKSRKILDQQREALQSILNGVKSHLSTMGKSPGDFGSIQLNLTARKIDILCLLGEKLDENFETAMAVWGVAGTVSGIQYQPYPSITRHQEPTVTSQTLADSLGLSLKMLDSQSFPAEAVNIELASVSSDSPFNGEGDGYCPAINLNNTNQDLSSSTCSSIGQLIPGKSSLKRSSLKEERSVKRVRFQV